MEIGACGGGLAAEELRSMRSPNLTRLQSAALLLEVVQPLCPRKVGRAVSPRHHPFPKPARTL